MRRARSLLVVLMLCLPALLLPGLVLPSSAVDPPASGPIRFGAAQSGSRGVSQAQAVQDLEATIGRSLGVVRVYDLWDSPFPDTSAQTLRDSGHTLFLSVKAKRRDGSPVLWADIAAAQPGDPLYDDMSRWSAALRDFAGAVTFSFNHEAETVPSRPSGNAEQFVAAYRAFAAVIRSAGAGNVRLAWTAAVRNFSAPPTAVTYAPAYYPGDEWVDDIAVDAYNMYCLRKDGKFSRPWRSLEQLLAPWMAFAAQHPGPGLAVAEWGSPEDPALPGRKAQWIDEARLLFQQPEYARVRTVSYWNQLSHNFAGCDFRVTTSDSALAAFTAMGQDPYFAG